MDHSIFGYLSRQSTQRLDSILDYYLHLEVCEYHAEIIRMILSILREREMKEPFPPKPEMLARYQELLNTLDE